MATCELVPVRHGVLSTVEEIIDEARNGRMFILVDDEDRENEGDLVIPAQKPLDSDLRHLFASWFNRGFLELRRIDLDTPAAILEKLILNVGLKRVGFLVRNPDQGGCITGGFKIVGNNDGNRLTIVVHLRIVQRLENRSGRCIQIGKLEIKGRERRPVFMRENIHNTGYHFSSSCVNGLDNTFRNGAVHHIGVQQMRHRILGGIRRSTRYFKRSFKSADRLTDTGLRHCLTVLRHPDTDVSGTGIN